MFRNLSVRENVQFGLRFPWRRGGRAADARADTDSLLERLGLIDQAQSAGRQPAADAATAPRDCDGARHQSAPPLLDEVAAGLTQSEAEDVASLIQSIRRERHITVIWIEHNVVTLMRAVDRVMVLHHGEVLADGLPDEVAQDRAVIDAYLGETGGVERC